ncbi:hypothetical protein [Modestobacter excelsi]|uniref:hypothetical protein n=1 Tax=Modestobacter excelsi TaxID=2213161 RepID=UPI00110CC123|nr:hypothetical protein [Modestobacter excelsi]
MAQRALWEAARLAASGTSVRVFAPTGEDLAAMGTNLFDASRRGTVFATAVRTTTSLLTSEDQRAGRRDVTGVA